MGTVIAVIIWVVVAVAIAFLCASIASKKGRSPALWGILGFVIPLIALILVLVLPRSGPEGSTPF